MQLNNEEKNITNELDDIIVKLLLPITNNLLIKTKELREKKLEFKKELNEMRLRKQALIQKRKRLMKQKAIHEKNLNGDLSNNKLCEELLINYINFVDKKETDFVKSKEDFYELKLRKKNLEFNQDLIRLIKEKSNSEKRKKMQKNHSFECIKNLNKYNVSLSKNIKNENKSFSIDKSNNKSISKAISTVTPKKADFNSNKKNGKKKNSYMRNKIIESEKNSNKNNISKEIESLINNYSSKKNEVKSYNSNNSDNFENGLIQMKEINRETKEIEKELKEMMNNFLSEENENEE